MLSIPGHVGLTSSNQIQLPILSIMLMGKDKLILTTILEQNPNFSYFYLLLSNPCVCLLLTAHITVGHLHIEKCLL